MSGLLEDGDVVRRFHPHGRAPNLAVVAGLESLSRRDICQGRGKAWGGRWYGWSDGQGGEKSVTDERTMRRTVLARWAALCSLNGLCQEDNEDHGANRREHLERQQH